MCALVGHEVQQLARVAVGRLGLAGLAVGEWRPLRPDEVARLAAGR
jgi:16S rRNA U516 pseudouridylate synthase RsuA-like enzyme